MSSGESSALIGVRWRSARLGRLQLVTARALDLDAIDFDWYPRRAVSAPHRFWNWKWICNKGHTESFALIDDTGVPAVLWSGTRKLTLLDGIEAYRLRFIEVDPFRVSMGFGRMAMLIVAKRALEAGNNALVLLAIPDRANFYRRIGGRENQVPRGWQSLPRGYIPFTFDRPGLEFLAEGADAARETE